MKRSAGILMPVFSLPGEFGIGTIGREAREFADFLHKAGQTWWQILPVGPAGEGNSPYSSDSTFAGNALFIDPVILKDWGLLTKAEVDEAKLPNTGAVDYEEVKVRKNVLLRKAFKRATFQLPDVEEFAERRKWVKEYALYEAAKGYFGGKSWIDWPDESLRRHEMSAVQKYREILSEEILFYECVQYWFFRQWTDFKSYVNGLGIKIIGDLPIYVSLDSADVWSEREQFLLDNEGYPEKVAGVPPDYFSEEGQLWGNPLYDWEHMKNDGFGWWIRRVDGVSCLVDAIRIDHFRGLASYWAVPKTAKTAKEGSWQKGPGMALMGVLTNWFPHITYIAEDLGVLSDDVHELRNASGLPGMKILEFAFDGPSNEYLPHNFETTHCICYTGGHDNNTLLGWVKSAKSEELEYASDYLGVKGEKAICNAVILLGQRSCADLFIAQVQDYLGLGEEARINVPGVPTGNWKWRAEKKYFTAKKAAEILKITKTFKR